MAAGNYTFNESTHGGRLLRNAQASFDNAYNQIQQVLGLMQQCLEQSGPGAGTVGTDFATIFGFADTTTGQNAYNEWSSFVSKLTTDSSVDTVMAAIKQAMNKFR